MPRAKWWAAVEADVSARVRVEEGESFSVEHVHGDRERGAVDVLDGEGKTGFRIVYARIRGNTYATMNAYKPDVAAMRRGLDVLGVRALPSVSDRDAYRMLRAHYDGMMARDEIGFSRHDIAKPLLWTCRCSERSDSRTSFCPFCGQDHSEADAELDAREAG